MIMSIIGFLSYQTGVDVTPPEALGTIAVWIIGMLIATLVFVWQNGKQEKQSERDKWAAVLAERQAMCDKERERDELRSQEVRDRDEQRSREMYDLLKSEIAKRDDRALKQQDILDKLTAAVDKLADRVGVKQ